MSSFRYVFRIVLIVLLLGLLGVVGWALIRSNPDRYWNRAQANLKANNTAAAVINLQSLVQRKPDHADGQEALATLLLKQGEDEKNPGVYSQGLSNLAEAAKLRPEDTELQRRLLDAALKANRLQTASVAAQRLIEKEPNNTDALYALALQAVSSKSNKAAELLSRFAAQPSPRQFQAFAMSEQYHREGQRNEERDQVLAQAANRVKELTDEQFAQLSDFERETMLRLLLMSLQEAPDVTAAHARAKQVLSACEKFPAQDDKTVTKLGEVATQVIGILEARHPVLRSDKGQTEERQQITMRGEKLQAAAIAANKAAPALYLQMAALAFSRSDLKRALEIAQQGIAAATDTPGTRPEDLVALRLLAARSQLVLRRFNEAREQAKLVLATPDVQPPAAGWAQLILGSVATAEGRLETSLEHYRKAEQTLGQTGVVQMALGNTHLALRQWKEALPYLQGLQSKLQVVDPEQQYFAQQHAITSATVHLGELRARLALGQWNEAQRNLQALRGTLLETQAEAAAAVYLWLNDRKADAQQLLNQARQRQPNDFLLILLQAAFLQQSGRAEDAEKLIEAAVAASPDDMRRQTYYVRWLAVQKRFDEAMAKLDELDQRSPNHPTLQYLRAEQLLVQGKEEEALQLAEKLRQTPEGSALGSLLAASIQLRQDNLEGASKLFGEVSERVGGHDGLQLAMGEIAAAGGDYVAAIDQVSNSLDVTKMRGRSRFALLRSVLLLASQKGAAEAEKVLLPIVQEHRDDPFVLTILADLQFKQGQFDEGMKLLNDAERLAPDSADIPFIKSGVLAQVGKLVESLAEIERAIEKNPKSVAVLNSAANLNLLMGKNDAADRYAQAALQINPEMWNLYLVRAEALGRSNRMPEALQLIADLLKKQPESLAAHRALVSLYLADKQPEAALAACRKAREVLPASFELIADEVTLLCSQNRAGEAGRLAELSVGEPVDPLKSLTLAQTFANQGQFDSAQQFAQRSLDAAADDQQKAAAHLLLGEVAMRKNTKGVDAALNDVARDHFAKVLEVNPRNLIAGNNLAWLLATEFDNAAAAIEIVDRVRGDAGAAQLPTDFVDTIAEVYRRGNRLEDAQLLLQQALDLRPNGDPKLLYQLGMVLAARKSPVLARNAFERAKQLGLSDERTTEADRQILLLDEAADAGGAQEEAKKPGTE